MDTATEPQSYGRGALAVIAVLVALASAALIIEGARIAVIAAILIAPFALYLTLVRPLAFPFGLYVVLVPFDNLLVAGHAGTFTKLLGIISGVFLLIWIARRGTNARPANSMLPLLLLIVWMLASIFWALDQGAAAKILPTYVGLIVLYVALCFTPLTMRDFRWLLGCVVAGGLAAALYGANMFYHNPPPAQEQFGRLMIQVGNSSIDPNHFANSLLFPFIVLGVWALRTPKLYAKLAGIAGCGLVIYAIMLSASREALVAAGAMALYLLWRSRYRLQIIVAAGACIATAASVQSSMWTRFASVLETGGSGRTSIWAVAIEAMKHRLLQGYGIGNFEQAYDQFYLSVQQTYPYGFSSPAHNIVFHYGVELGIVGLFLIGWFFWRQFRSLADVDANPELHDFRLMLEGAIIAIAIVSLSIDLFTYKYAWLVFAAIALFRNAAASDTQSEEIRRESSAMMALRSARL